MSDVAVELLSPIMMESTIASRWAENAWSSGMLLLPLSELYLSSQDAMKPHELVFVRSLAARLTSDLSSRIFKLTKNLPNARFGLCLSGDFPGVQMEGSALIAAAKALTAKLMTASNESLKNGVLSLLVSEHVYNKCVWCDQAAVFTLSDAPDQLMVPKMYIETPDRKVLSEWLGKRWSPQSLSSLEAWLPYLGVCRRCNYTCTECGHQGPKVFDLVWMKSLKDDKICPECGNKLLANVKSPTPGRRELVALHRKSFLDL